MRERPETIRRIGLSVMDPAVAVAVAGRRRRQASPEASEPRLGQSVDLRRRQQLVQHGIERAEADGEMALGRFEVHGGVGQL